MPSQPNAGMPTTETTEGIGTVAWANQLSASAGRSVDGPGREVAPAKDCDTSSGIGPGLRR